MQKFLNPEKDYDPKSFFIPWCQKTYRKITVEDVKYVLSLHYQHFCKCVLTKSNGEQATVVSGDINLYKYALIVELENHDVRVVDRETLTLAKANPHENLGNHKKINKF